MLSAADVLAEYLKQYSPSPVDANWPVFVSLMNDSPNQCISIYDTHPDIEGRVHRTREVIEHQGIMIAVRSLDYSSGFTKTVDICTALAAIPASACFQLLIPANTGSPYRLWSFRRTNGPNPLPNDARQTKNARYLFSVNGYLTYEAP
jgi:hypothetical protein